MNRKQALWLTVSIGSLLFIATELTPRPTNSSGTIIGRIWNRIGLTGMHGSIRDGEMAGFNEFYVRQTAGSFELLSMDDLFSSYEEDPGGTLTAFEPMYRIRAIVTYQWSGFVYKASYSQSYAFDVADAETWETLSVDPILIANLKSFTADNLESGELNWNEKKAPRWPSDLRSNSSGWTQKFPRAHFWDGIWCLLFAGFIASVITWIALETRQSRSKKTAACQVTNQTPEA